MPSPSPYRGAAVRILRWLPLLAGLIAVDRIDGVKGLLIGLVVAIDVAAVSVTCHNHLTRSVAGPVGEPTWLEAMLVWLNVTVLLAAQVALGDPGGTAGRIAAVLGGLAIGAFASELAATRFSLATRRT